MPSSLIAPIAGAAVSSLLNGGSSGGGGSSAADTQAAIGQAQWDRYQKVFAPLEDKYVQEAQNYDTPEQYAKAAGEASATVSQQFSKARGQLGRSGVDTSSPAYTASVAGLDQAQAAQDAVSQNSARQGVKDTAWARKTDALSLGKGLPAQASAALGSASSSQLAQSNANANAAAAGGRVASNVFNSPTVQGWLGNVNSTANAAGGANAPGGSNYGANIGFD